jgi:hypothetical protein
MKEWGTKVEALKTMRIVLVSFFAMDVSTNPPCEDKHFE